MARVVNVTLTGLKCFAVGPDPGSNLEIYGDLYARRTFVNEFGDFQSLQTFPLWHKGPHEWVNIARDNTLTINATAEGITIHPGEWLFMGGHLAEQDEWPSANDNLGFVDKKISHDALPGAAGPHTVTFQEGGQVVEARFSIVPMN